MTYTATASDNCPGASIGGYRPVTQAPLGQHDGEGCTASDTSGNTATCFTVTVNDTEHHATCADHRECAPGVRAVGPPPRPAITAQAPPVVRRPVARPSKGSTVVPPALDASGNTANCSSLGAVNDTSARPHLPGEHRGQHRPANARR